METDLFAWLNRNFGITLNEQQQKAVTDNALRILLLAVPGAGKTTVLVTRIAHLMLEKKIPASQILTITFNRESAKDMQQRFVRLFGDVCAQPPQFSTIHSFCYRVLRYYANLRQTQLPILLEDRPGSQEHGGQYRMIGGIYREMTGEMLSEELYEQIVQVIGYGKNMMLTPEEMAREIPDCRVFLELYQRYERCKREQKRFDYDDMLCYTLTVFRRYPQILNYFAGRYRYLHVDEAQDTSLLQHEIIRMMVHAGGESLSLFMVGDEDQSIYGFRGAYPRVLLQFAQWYPGGQVLKMEENFRSTGEIVARAAAFISGNRERYEKHMITHQEKGEPVTQKLLENLSGQYPYLAGAVQRLAPGETLAILYRNNDSGLPVADLLDRKGLPFYIRDHQPSLKNHFVVVDLLHFLRLYRNPADLDAFGRVYYRMNAYLSREDMEYVRQNSAHGENVFDILLSREQQRATARLQFLKYAIAGLGDHTPLRMIQVMETDLGYLDFLDFRYSGTQRELALYKLGALKSIARNCENLEQFLTRLDGLDQVVSSHSKVQPDCQVTLSTIHSSKGMEFDRVILIDMLDGQLPSAKAIEQRMNGELTLFEEEARLFYVGATRAKNHLEILTSSLSDSGMVTPSRFIRRIISPASEIIAKDGQTLPYHIGDRIHHRYYSTGVILSVDPQKGHMVVHFDRYGVKTLSLAVLISKSLCSPE